MTSQADRGRSSTAPTRSGSPRSGATSSGGRSSIAMTTATVEIGDGGDGLDASCSIPVPEPKTIKNRIHLDVDAVDGDQHAEVERILALGARAIDIGQGDVSWVVLADPEGNEFCVLSGARLTDSPPSGPAPRRVGPGRLACGARPAMSHRGATYVGRELVRSERRRPGRRDARGSRATAT